MTNEIQKSIHDGHRQRMFDKIEKGGLEALLSHEILEVLLFYTIPRRNTNEIGHALMHQFGSLANVLDADADELLSVEGMGQASVRFLKLLPALFRRYELDKLEEKPCFDRIEAAMELGRALFIGETRECVYALILNNRLCKIDCVKLACGSINSVDIDMTELYKSCINKRASAVILYHNHPDGIALPSRRDCESTYQIEMKLADIHVKLLEHFVVAEGRACPILRMQKGYARPYVHHNEIEDVSIERFYHG